ncbi:hypothetical protein [Rossellomorea sp. BNER]|uniref:hypothetical protein n=1 Tax=Rossellomorea sp. BNER TaxID=2962031 RepID=UPI003AF23AD0|nr:hypothetical protein [Rossellomorea sp. BNER]
MQLVENQPVYCESSLFSGNGKVNCILQNEMFGVQVLMDEPDPDGHRLKRFAIHEVRPFNEKKNINSEPVLEPGTMMMANAGVDITKRLSKGQLFFINQHPDKRQPRQIFLYDPHTENPVGGCPLDHLENIRPIDKSIFKTERQLKTIQVIKPKKKSTSNELQLSFDF